MKPRKLMLAILLRIARLLWGHKLSQKFPLISNAFYFLFAHLGGGHSEFINVEGGKLYVSPRSQLRGHIAVIGAYEKLVRELLKKEIKPGMTVIELGAHIGYHTLFFAKLVGEKGKVFAFEPDPANFALLTKNITINGYKNVYPVQKAVSNTVGKAKFFLDNDYSSRHHLYEDCYVSQPFITVDTVTLDEFFKDLQVDFIKMDVEGVEMVALEGMTNIVEKSKNLKITTEFFPYALRRAGSSPEEFLEKLTKYGFRLYDINEKKKSVEPRDCASLLEVYNGEEKRVTNLLCVKER